MSDIKEIGFFRTDKDGEELNQTINDHVSENDILFVENTKRNDLYIGDKKITDRFNVGDKADEIQTMKVGGLDETTIGDLRNKSVSDILFQILCPRVNPIVPNNKPSINISYSGSELVLVKVGTTLPNEDDIVVNIDRGKFSNGEDYAGECDDVTKTMIPSKWGETSKEEIYEISVNGTFLDGDSPKDTYGEVVDDLMFKSKSIESNDINIVSVYPIYINTEDITVMTEQQLINYYAGATLEVSIPKEVDGMDKFKVQLPEGVTMEVKQWSPLTLKYDIDIIMSPIEEGSLTFIRTLDEKNTNTDVVKYEIKFKK